MRIAILSRNPKLYSTRRLVEAARNRGHEVRVLDHLKCSVGMEAGNPTLYINKKIITDIDAVIPRIGSSVTFYGTAIVRQFEMMNVFTTVTSQAILRSRDKLRTLQLLSQAAIGIPKTIFASRPHDVESLIHKVGGAPVVIKILEGTQGIGVVLAESRKAAKSVIEAFYGLEADILIQEYIKESTGMDIRAFIVDGKVVASMKRTSKTGEFRSNLHRGGVGEKVILTAKEKSIALKAASALGLNIAGVDMLRSSRGPLILEVNSSPGLRGIESVTKVDIAGKIIEYVEKNKRRKPGKDMIGV